MFLNAEALKEVIGGRLGQIRQDLQFRDYQFDYMLGYEEYLQAKKEYEQWEKTHRKDIEDSGGVAFVNWLGTVAVRPFQGLEYLGQLMKSAGHSDLCDLENYIPMNIYDMPLTSYVNVTRSAIGENIENPLLKAGYELGTGVVDGLVNMAISKIPTIGPGLSILTQAGTAAADTAYDIILRGGTNDQAMLGGVAMGVIEGVCEKVSIDSLFGKNMSVSGWKKWVRQGAVGLSEELATQCATVCVDAFNMGNKSQYELSVQKYMQDGLTRAEAQEKATQDLIAETLLSAAGGFATNSISGAVIDLGKRKKGSGETASLLQSALELPPDTQAHKLAAELSDKLETALTEQGIDAADLYQMSRTEQDALIERTMDAAISDRELGELNQLMGESLTQTDSRGKVSAAEEFPSLRNPNDEQIALAYELMKSGNKCMPENIVGIAREAKSGQIVWIETGNEKAGLKHIILEHGQQFSNVGIENDMIAGYIMEAVSKGKIVGFQGSKNPRAIYEFEYEGTTRRIAVSIGTNGYIVGANPKSWKG